MVAAEQTRTGQENQQHRLGCANSVGNIKVDERDVNLVGKDSCHNHRDGLQGNKYAHQQGMI